MGSRRDQIRMSDREVRAFLEEQLVMTVGTVGPQGRPHLMPLWYVPDGDELIGWTYAKSQKTKNLERDPRATVQVEHGVRYEELRGVMMECDVTLDRDAKEYGMRLFGRYAGELDHNVEALVEKQAEKRVGLRFTPTRTVSWDHSKLGGTY
ncbi:MAG TPA: pyridoxamine 5'-phosphate oxidase family protein [Thermoleophilaceae bacterium]|nr:pyridoxamine 5'-phosphate oxidase family protein [Thermoleophilaceae bacterium]